jgi:tetratricopeptide (TPR) repeat protein
MATLQELAIALDKADAAGDTDAARDLAAAIRSMQAQEPVTAPKAAQSPVRPATAPSGVGYDAVMSMQPMSDEMALFQAVNRAPAVAGMMVDTAAEGGLSSAGQAIGAMTGPAAPVAIPVLGAIGGAGGNALAQKRQVAMGERENYSLGEMAGSAFAGAFPGGSLARAGWKPLAKEGLKASAINVGATTLQEGVDGRGLPSATQFAVAGGLGAVAPALARPLDAGSNPVARTAVKANDLNVDHNRIVQDMMDMGMKLPPSYLNKEGSGFISKFSNVLESIAGPVQSAKKAVQINNLKTDAAFRRDLALPENARLVEDTFTALKKQLNRPYEEIEAMATKAQADLVSLKKSRFDGPLDVHDEAIRASDPKYVEQKADLDLKAAASLDAWKKKRDEARSLYQSANSGFGNRSELLEKAEKATEDADKLYDKILTAVEAAGRPQLAKDLAYSRKTLAKLAIVEKSVSPAGTVDAAVVGKELEKGRKLDGEVKKVAEAYGEFGRLLRDSTKEASPNVNNLSAVLFGGFGSSVGYTYGGTPGAALGMLAGVTALPMAQQQLRNAIMSKPWMRAVQGSNYQSGMPDIGAAMARYAAMRAGRPYGEQSQ